MTILWQDDEVNGYYIGVIGKAKFFIDKGVGAAFGVVFAFQGDAYGVLSTAASVGEAKRFSEWLARAHGLDLCDETPQDADYTISGTVPVGKPDLSSAAI